MNNKTIALIIVLLFLSSEALADITYFATTGQLLYVRIKEGAGYVAVDLDEQANLGEYAVSDAALVTAGLDVVNRFPGHYYSIRAGATPSTTANDAVVASGVLPWSGSAEVPPTVLISDGTGTGEIDTASGVALADVNKINGDAAAANNAEAYFDGTGYGAHVIAGQVDGIITQTAITIELPVSGVMAVDDLKDCRVLIREGNQLGIRRITASSASYGANLLVDLTLDSALPWTVTAVANYTVLPPDFRTEDRTSLLAVKARTDFLPSATAGAAGGLPTLDANLNVQADLERIGDAAITDTSDRVAAAFSTMFNVVSPVFTAQSVNQTGDAFGIVDSGTHGNAAIKGFVDDIGVAGAGLTAIPSVGSVIGSVGSITGVTFPTNFGALGINVSGHISRVTLADTLTTYTGNTPQTGDAFARLGAPAGASVSADIATRLAPTTAGRTLDVNATGGAEVDLAQSVSPTGNTANTIGDALNAARAQGFGKWSLNTTTRIMTLYAPDGTTVVASFLIDPNLTAPLTRTPQ